MFNGADYLIFAIIGVSAFMGLWRGLVKEAFSLLIWAAAFGLAYYFGDQLATYLPLGELAEGGESSIVSGTTVARIVVFVTTLILGSLISFLVQSLIKVTGLSSTDKLLGFVFGLSRGALVILALLVILPAFAPLEDQNWWQNSASIPYFLAFEDWATGLLGSPGTWLNAILNRGN